MRRFLTGVLPCLLPASALAGPQYSAEDVIRYFQEANAVAAAPAAPVQATRSVVIGDPGAKALPAATDASVGASVGAGVGAGDGEGVVIGSAPKPALPAMPATKTAAAPPDADAPLAIPMTGAKAGHGVTPAALTTTEVASAAEPAPATRSAGPDGASYDMLVTFEIDSAVLTPQARQNLDAFANALTSPALSALRFAVEGHTDSTGSAEHNLALSERRAASVVSYLVENGVAPDRLSGEGFGETRPRLADPEHPENRRVETRRLD